MYQNHRESMPILKHKPSFVYRR